jgi:hypothetical protein
MSTTNTQSTGTIQGVQETAAPGPAVFKSIQDANYASEGAPFSPLRLKFAAASDLENGWNSDRGDTQISFFRSRGAASPADTFLPLGDFALINNGNASKAPVMLVAPILGNEKMLAHPKGFDWILDDHGSGNSSDVAYYWPKAPDGYEALGICLGFNGDAPKAENYWCVNTAILQDVQSKGFWGDGGQGWKSWNGDLNVVDLTNVPTSKDKMLLAPTTLLSVQKGGDLGRCLVLDKLMLPGAHISTPQPVYSADTEIGDQTASGLASVAVLPCTVVADTSTSSGPKTDPFYYMASQPYWDCIEGFPSPNGGSRTDTVTVGTSSESSQGFQNTTSLTVGADVGIEADGFSAHMSVSYTHEMQVTADSKIGKTTDTTVSLTLNLPTAQQVFVWQKLADIMAYRTEGSTEEGPTILSAATFQKNETTFSQSTP